MVDTPSKTTWTDAAQNELLLHIINHLLEGGKSVNWKKIKIEGRTLKSLTNQWTKIRKQMSELEVPEDDNDGAGQDGTPVKKSGKGRPKKASAVSDDDDTPSKKVAPKKRGADANGVSNGAKRVKKDDDDDSLSEIKDESDDIAGEV